MSIYTPKREKRMPKWVEDRQRRRFFESQVKKNDERIRKAIDEYRNSFALAATALPSAGSFN